ncbi:MAG: tyrosine-type recombinase/integrase, partial [bacterium]
NRIITLDVGKTVTEKPQYIPIDDTLHDVLKGLRSNPNRDKWVFPYKYKRGHLTDVRQVFHKALKRSGIAEERRRAGRPPLRFHDLRHTAASLMLMSGEPLEAVQALLRHRNITTTQRYAHLSPAYMQKSVSKLDEMLTSSTKSSTVAKVIPLRSKDNT